MRTVILIDVNLPKGRLRQLMDDIHNASKVAQLCVNQLDGSFHVIVTGDERDFKAMSRFNPAMIAERYQKPGYVEVTFTAAKENINLVALGRNADLAKVSDALDELFAATHDENQTVVGDPTRTNIAVYTGSDDTKRALFAKTKQGWRQMTDFMANIDFAVTDDAVGYGKIGDTTIMGATLAGIKKAVRSSQDINWQQVAELDQPLAYFGRGIKNEIPVNLQGKYGRDYVVASFKTDGGTLKLELIADTAVRSTDEQVYDEDVIGVTGAQGDKATLAFRGNGSGPTFVPKTKVNPELWQLATRSSGLQPQSASGAK